MDLGLDQFTFDNVVPFIQEFFGSGIVAFGLYAIIGLGIGAFGLQVIIGAFRK